MKKIILVVAVAGLAMASCKKDRVCSCTNTYSYTISNVTTTGTSTQDVTYNKVSGRTAKLACISRKSTDANSSYTFDCKLK